MNSKLVMTKSGFDVSNGKVSALEVEEGPFHEAMAGVFIGEEHKVRSLKVGIKIS